MGENTKPIVLSARVASKLCHWGGMTFSPNNTYVLDASKWSPRVRAKWERASRRLERHRTVVPFKRLLYTLIPF